MFLYNLNVLIDIKHELHFIPDINLKCWGLIFLNYALDLYMDLFNKIYRSSWFVLILMLIFFNRQNVYWVISTLCVLFFVSSIAILRAFESRNEWRNYIKEENLDDNIA